MTMVISNSITVTVSSTSTGPRITGQYVGLTLQVEGVGFTPLATAAMWSNIAIPGVPNPLVLNTDGNGNINFADLTTQVIAYTIYVIDTSTGRISNSITIGSGTIGVNPRISASLSSTYNIVVTGTGYTSGQNNAKIFLQTVMLGVNTVSYAAVTNGSFSYTINATGFNGLPQGAYSFSVFDVPSGAQSNSLTVIVPSYQLPPTPNYYCVYTVMYNATSFPTNPNAIALPCPTGNSLGSFNNQNVALNGYQGQGYYAWPGFDNGTGLVPFYWIGTSSGFNTINVAIDNGNLLLLQG